MRDGELSRRSLHAARVLWIREHEDPRKTPSAELQISEFLAPNGTVLSVCGGNPCHTSVFAP